MQCVLPADNAGVFTLKNKSLALRVNTLMSCANSYESADAQETRNECCLAKIARRLCVCASVGCVLQFGNCDSKEEVMSSLKRAHT